MDSPFGLWRAQETHTPTHPARLEGPAGVALDRRRLRTVGAVARWDVGLGVRRPRQLDSIVAAELPEWSLLAHHRGIGCYRDAFVVEVAGTVSLSAFIAHFFGSKAFWPERMVLHLIGRGANRADIAALANGHSKHFAAWSVEARTDYQILLRDFQDRTCSWLAVEAVEGERATRLWFGSGLRRPEAFLVRTLTPVHRWYSRRLLAGAVRVSANLCVQPAGS